MENDRGSGKETLPFLKYGSSWRVYLIAFPLKRKPGIPEAISISTTTPSPSYIILVGRVAHCQARPCQLLQMLAAQRRWCSSWVRGVLATLSVQGFGVLASGALAFPLFGFSRRPFGILAALASSFWLPHSTKRGEALQLLSCFCSIMVHAE